MKRFITFLTLVALLVLAAPVLVLAAKVGQPAPDFTGTASNNQTYHLADYHGKFVVLEWHNNGCPYTQKHYMSGNMQKLQKQWTGQGIVWFTIISSAPGKQGYVERTGRTITCRRWERRQPRPYSTLRARSAIYMMLRQLHR